MYLGLIRWKIIKRIRKIHFPSVASQKPDMAKMVPEKQDLTCQIQLYTTLSLHPTPSIQSKSEKSKMDGFCWYFSSFEVNGLLSKYPGGVEREREREYFSIK